MSILIKRSKKYKKHYLVKEENRFAVVWKIYICFLKTNYLNQK